MGDGMAEKHPTTATTIRDSFVVEQAFWPMAEFASAMTTSKAGVVPG